MTLLTDSEIPVKSNVSRSPAETQGATTVKNQFSDARGSLDISPHSTVQHSPTVLNGKKIIEKS